MQSKITQLSRTLEEYITLVSSSFINSIFYRKRCQAEADIRRIVVIKLDHMGDVILSIPVVANLKAGFPEAKITMVVNSSSRSIANYIPHVDDIIYYDARFFDRSGNKKMFDVAGALRFAGDIKKRDFDLIVDLRGSYASLLAAVRSITRFMSSPARACAARSYMPCQVWMRSSFFKNGVASKSVAYNSTSGAYSVR